MHIDDIFQHTFKAIGQQLGLRVRMVDGHLQIKDLIATICIVEAEKTAVILSELYPQYVWLAAGGLFELQPQKFLSLRHHKVVLFPDTDSDCKAYTIWYNTAQQVMQSFFWPRSNVIYVSDFLERDATAEQKERKIDLVDFIIESRSKST